MWQRPRVRCDWQVSKRQASTSAVSAHLPHTRLQNFLYEHGLQNKPIVAMGISAGASFAVKVGARHGAKSTGHVRGPANWAAACPG